MLACSHRCRGLCSSWGGKAAYLPAAHSQQRCSAAWGALHAILQGTGQHAGNRLPKLRVLVIHEVELTVRHPPLLTGYNAAAVCSKHLQELVLNVRPADDAFGPPGYDFLQSRRTQPDAACLSCACRNRCVSESGYCAVL